MMRTPSSRISNLLGRSTEKLLRGTTYILLLRVVAVISGFGTVAILTRSLTKEHTGTYFLVLQLSNIATVLSLMGGDYASQRYLALARAGAPKEIRKVYFRILSMVTSTTCVTLAVIGGSWWLWAGSLFPADVLPWLLVFQLVFVVVITNEHFQAATLRALDELFRAAAAETLIRQLSTFLLVGALSLLLRDGFTLYHAMAAWSCGGLLSLVTSHWWIQRRLRVVIHEQPHGEGKRLDLTWRRLLQTSWTMGVTNSTAVLQASLDLVLVGWILGPAAAGLYGPLRRVANLVRFLMQSIGKMLTPIVAQLHARGDLREIASVSRKGSTLGALLGIPMATVLFLFGDRLLVIAFGDKYADLGLVLAILTLGPLFVSLLGTPNAILQMTGHEKSALRVSVSMSLLSLMMIIVLAKPLELVGVALAFSATLLGQLLLLSWLVYRKLGIRIHASPFAFQRGRRGS